MEDDESNQQQQKPPPSLQQQASPRRVLIVADPTRESSDALQYAISHALVSGDEVILIHVIITSPSQSIALATLSVLQNKRNTLGNFLWKSPPASPRPQNNNQNSKTTTSGSSSSSTSTAPTTSLGGSGGGRLDQVYLPSWNALSSLFVKFENMAVGSVAAGAACSTRDHVQGCGGSCGVSPGGGSIDFLEAMKKDCEVAFPCMKVKIEKVNSGTMDKASVILFKSMELEIDLLIIGQRRSIASVLLGPRKAISIPGAKGGGSGVKTVDTADYLIEHSECSCVGVQKKAQNAGYLINTKTRKNFWLLA